MDATWLARPRGSAMRAHAAPMRHDVTYTLFIYIVHIGVIVHISLPIIGNMLPLISDISYKPVILL